MNYDDWAATYELFAGQLSRSTWREGICAVVEQLGITDGQVLDVGAGTGIGAAELRAVGTFEVTSLDRSEAMLRQAIARSDEIIQASMTNFQTNQKYDLIVSGFDSVNYLDDYDLSEFFARSASSLAVTGHLIFDYSSPTLLQHAWQDEQYVQRESALSLSWDHQWDAVLQRSQTDLTLQGETGETLWSERHFQYSYDPFIIEALARRAGMRVASVRNLESTSSFTPGAHTHVYHLIRLVAL